MPGRFTNGPEPQPSEQDRIRNLLLNHDPSIQDFNIATLANGTIEIIVATSADIDVLDALGAGEFEKVS